MSGVHIKRLTFIAIVMLAIACGRASAQNSTVSTAKRYEWQLSGTEARVIVVDMPDGTRCYTFPVAGNAWGTGCVWAHVAGFNGTTP